MVVIAHRLTSLDTRAMQREVRGLFAQETAVSQPGFYHDGRWKGVTLYGSRGKMGTAAFEGPAAGVPRFTAAALALPRLKAELERLPFSISSARLMMLPPGGKIGSHRDPWHRMESGLIRLNLIIEQPLGTRLIIDGERCAWQEGELWWADFSREHSVDNGDGLRSNLIVDAETSRELLSHFPPEQRGGFFPSPPVVADAGLADYECVLDIDDIVAPFIGSGTGTVRVLADAGWLSLYGMDGRCACDLLPIGGGQFRVRGGPPSWVLRISPGHHTASASAGFVDRAGTYLPGARSVRVVPTDQLHDF